MTPAKCARHEYRPGEFADGPRYTRALIESRSCWRCRLLAARAYLVWGAIRLRMRLRARRVAPSKQREEEDQ